MSNSRYTDSSPTRLIQPAQKTARLISDFGQTEKATFIWVRKEMHLKLVQ
jgi:hypothetical protein